MQCERILRDGQRIAPISFGGETEFETYETQDVRRNLRLIEMKKKLRKKTREREKTERKNAWKEYYENIEKAFFLSMIAFEITPPQHSNTVFCFSVEFGV